MKKVGERAQPTEYRVHEWLNTKTREPFWGIQAKVDGMWCHVAEGGDPLFFQEKEDAIAKALLLNSSDAEGTMVLPVINETETRQ